MPLGAGVITNFGAGPARQPKHFNRLIELYPGGIIRVHPQGRYRVTPDAHNGLLIGCSNVHQAGIVGDHAGRLPQQGGRLVELVAATGVVYVGARLGSYRRSGGGIVGAIATANDLAAALTVRGVVSARGEEVAPSR